jgi:fructose-1,6-bisphosphatase/inositol monophosphatase family enzyme
MRESPPDIDRVTALLGQVAAEVILPRFGSLRMDETERKTTAGDPNDVVTVVDRLAEERLTAALAAMAPGVPLIGEEAAYGHPELLDLLELDGPVWILDPIDGTRSYARGDDRFGVMLAWVVAGRSRAAWILLPARQESYVAEAGGGTWRDGVRTELRPAPPAGPPRGTAHTRFMKAPVREAVEGALHDRSRAVLSSGSAALEYTGVLKGTKEFVIYHRLLPWDHAPGALILTEAGGRVEHLDGTAYTPRSKEQVTIVAASATIASEIRREVNTRLGVYDSGRVGR